MGATHVDATIRNPARPQRSWTANFLADTGAFDSLVPRTHLEMIGLEPRSRHRRERACRRTMGRKMF